MGLLAIVTASLSAHAQSSERYVVQDFSIRYVIKNAIVRPELHWTVEVRQSLSFVTLDIRDRSAGKNRVLSVPTFDDVNPGHILADRLIDTEYTIGDLVQYSMRVSSGGGVGTRITAHIPRNSGESLRIPGPPQVAPPDIAASYLSGTSTPTINTRLTWGEVTGDENTGYTEITGYEIQYRFGDDGEWTPVSPAPSDTARTYEHVLSGGDIHQGDLRYRIRATNEITELENGPQGPWSETVSPTLVTMDLNTDGSIGGDDMLILYYSLELEDEFESDTDRNTSTVGPLAKTLIGGLLRSTEFTDADVLAAWDRALLLEEFGGSAIGSINASSGIDADDALILYYAAAFRDLLGDGNSGGFESMRSALLTQPSRLIDPTDIPLKAVLQSANDFLNRYR